MPLGAFMAPIKAFAVAHRRRAAPLVAQEEVDRPYLPDLERSLRADLLPAFRAGLPAAPGSCNEVPITFLLWPMGRRRNGIVRFEAAPRSSSASRCWMGRSGRGRGKK